MKLHEIVLKLSGPINPVGETNADNARFENLKELCECVDELLSRIDAVAMGKDHHALSISRAGKYADEFQTRMGIQP